VGKDINDIATKEKVMKYMQTIEVDQVKEFPPEQVIS